MKLWFVLGMAYVVTCFATDEEQFLQAYRCYNTKEYARALELYQAIQSKGSSVWYNMGNCAFHVQNYAHARLYWKQAERQASADQLADIAYNLDVLETKIGNSSRGMSWHRMIFRSAALLSLRMWQILFLLCWGIVLLMVGKRFFMGKAVALLCVCGMVLSGVGMCGRYMRNTQRIAMVTAHEACLYAGPDSRYQLLKTIDAMSEVAVQEKRDNWCKVRHNTTVGWMPIETLAVV